MEISKHVKFVIWSLSIIVLILLNLFSWNERIKGKTSIGEDSGHQEEKKQVLLHHLKDAYATNGKTIPNVMLKPLKTEAVSLSELIDNRKALILIFDDFSCDICLDILFLELNKYASKVNSNTTVIGIAQAKSIHYLNQFVRVKKTQFPLYWDSGRVLNKKLAIHLQFDALMD